MSDTDTTEGKPPPPLEEDAELAQPSATGSGSAGADLRGDDLIRAWVEALRSGEYEQGKGYLRVTDEDGQDKFCCLGVLCEVAGLRPVDIEVDAGGATVHFYPDDGFPAQGEPPYSVKRRAGLDGGHSGEVTTLVSMNDADGASFDEIADHIEEKILPQVRETAET